MASVTGRDTRVASFSLLFLAFQMIKPFPRPGTNNIRLEGTRVTSSHGKLQTKVRRQSSKQCMERVCKPTLGCGGSTIYSGVPSRQLMLMRLAEPHLSRNEGTPFFFSLDLFLEQSSLFLKIQLEDIFTTASAPLHQIPVDKACSQPVQYTFQFLSLTVS